MQLGNFKYNNYRRLRTKLQTKLFLTCRLRCPLVMVLFTSLHFFAKQRYQWSIISGKENENTFVLLFSSLFFHARDLHHPRATKRSLVIQLFQRCFHRQAFILFQCTCVVSKRSQPPFATIKRWIFFCTWIFHARDLNDSRATKSTISKMFSKTSFNSFSVCRFR